MLAAMLFYLLAMKATPVLHCVVLTRRDTGGRLLLSSVHIVFIVPSVLKSCSCVVRRVTLAVLCVGDVTAKLGLTKAVQLGGRLLDLNT